MQSRWITTACRILRLYVSTSNPDEALKYLAQYVIRVYAPVWFGVRKRPGCADGPRHLWQIVKLSNFLPDELKKIVHSVVQINGYYAQPENLLVAMATDENRDIRRLAWRRIKKCHYSKKKKINKVRVFQVPKLQFEATEYYECIDWFSTDISEPPITKSISSEEIEDNINSGSMLDESFVCFPSHSQAVERTVKLVTEAAGMKKEIHL